MPGRVAASADKRRSPTDKGVRTARGVGPHGGWLAAEQISFLKPRARYAPGIASSLF